MPRAFDSYKQRVEKEKAKPPPDPTDDADVVMWDTPDPYVGTPEVITLNDLWFYPFIKDKDAAMILFYDTSNPQSDVAKTELIQAAQNTQRDSHVYGAVDCPNNRVLCLKEGIFKVSLPAFKLYSLGELVGRYDETLLAKDIKKFVEVSPVPDKKPVLQKVCEALRIPRK